MPAGDITQGYTFVPAEKNIDAPKMNAIVGQASINPVFVSGQVQASSTAAGDYFLLYKANGTLAKILYDDLASSLAAATGFQQQVWAVRLRSFNAIGNPNFEVDQRNAGTAVGMNQLAQDRWAFYKTGMTTAGWTAGQQTPTSRIQVPGTSFSISRTFIRLTLTTPQSTLAAGDFTYGIHQVEGPSFRELQDDVHSLQLLVRSSVAPVSFGVALTDQAPPTRTLTKLCTIPVANTWTLIQLPNLPIWPPTGNFQSDAGVAGYQLRFLFACGPKSALSVWISPFPAIGPPTNSIDRILIFHPVQPPSSRISFCSADSLKPALGTRSRSNRSQGSSSLGATYLSQLPT